jgi:oxygen-independent coproporphyrinogen-3 oxidase
MNKPKSLYIHIPFCKHICAYCDFVKAKYHRELSILVLDRILEDAQAYEGPFETIYLGGGTPSVLEIDQLKRLGDLINQIKTPTSEVTMEINPETITQDKVKAIVKMGVNRISVGIQATQEHLLKTLTRQHSFAQAKEVIRMFYNAGIHNVSVDAMYGIPGQTIEDFKVTLDEFIALDVNHISLYALTIEDNTPFGRQHIEPVDNELEGEFYELAHDVLVAANYDHYEVSSFSKVNKKSRHNLAYWHYDDFVGIGPGAASKVGLTRITNTHNLHHYVNKSSLIFEKVELSEQESLFEFIMMGLRLSEGINIQRIKQKYDIDFMKQYQDAITQAQNNEWLVCEGTTLKTTNKGRLFLHDVLLLFMN